MNQLLASSASTSSTEGLIYVDETDYSDDDWVLPFEQRGVVRIRTDEKFSEFYEIFGTIGEGKFGTVYRCREKSTGLELAAKRIAIKRDADKRNVEQEVAIMQKMRHPRIAQIYDAFATKKNDIILIMEVVEGGELFDRVADENYVLTELAVVMIICQLCEAISYIHSQNIVHLDVKPENIMCVSHTGNRIKLIDFGLAQYYDGSKDLLLMAGTPEFAAPEVIKFEPIDFHTDMWSVGVITYILLSGISPFLGDNNAETYNNVTKGEWEFDAESFSGISDQAKHFVSNLIVYDKNKRMSAKECLEHPWIVESRRIAKQSSVASILDSPAIDTEKLRHYVHMRRWKVEFDRLFSDHLARAFQKATLAIFAVQRMGWNWLSKRLRLAKCVTNQQIANREAVESAEKIVALKTNQSLKKSASLSPKENAVSKAASSADGKVPLKSQALVIEEQALPPEKKPKRLKTGVPASSSETPTIKKDVPCVTSSPAVITADALKSPELNAPKLTEDKKKEKSSAAQPSPPSSEPSKPPGKVSSIAKNLSTKASLPVIAIDSPPAPSKIENVRRAFVFNSRAQRDATATKTIQLPSRLSAVATGTTEGLIKIRKKWTEHFSAIVSKSPTQTETAQAGVTDDTAKPTTSAKNTVTPPSPRLTAGVQQNESESAKPAKITKRPTVKIEKPDENITVKPSTDNCAPTSRSADTGGLALSSKDTSSSGNSVSNANQMLTPDAKPVAIKKKSTMAKTTELKLKTTESKPDATPPATAKRAKELEDKTDTITKVQQLPDNSTAEKLPLMPLATGLAAAPQRRKPSVANPSSAIVKLCAAVLGDRQPRERDKCSSDIDADTSGDEQNKTPVAAPCSSNPTAADAKPTPLSSKAAVASPSAMNPSSAGMKQMPAVPKLAVCTNSANAVVGSVPSTSPSKAAKSSSQLSVDENNRATTAGAATVDPPAKSPPSLSTSKSTTKRLIVPKVEANTDESSKQTNLPAGQQQSPAKNTNQTSCASTMPPANVSGDKQILIDAVKSEGKQTTSKKPATKSAEAKKLERPTKEFVNSDPTTSTPAPASTISSSSPTKLLRQNQNIVIAEASEAQSSKSVSQKQEKSSADQQLSKEAKELTVDDTSTLRKKAAVRTTSKTETTPTVTPSKKTKPLETAQSEPTNGLQSPPEIAKATSSSSKSVVKRKVQPSPKTASKSLSGETIVPKKIVCEDHLKDNDRMSTEASNSNSIDSKATTSINEDKINGLGVLPALPEDSEFKKAKSLLESRLTSDAKAAPEKKPAPRKQGDLTGNALRALQTWKNRDEKLAASKQAAEPPRLAVSAI